jgi:predicted pyridoxine 5'-phosphate oxidase superfamily flavin-nucleotide-binding protein
MSGRFHAGELELQRRAGVLDDARDLGRILAPEIPDGAARFLQSQRFAVAAGTDTRGQVWAAPLAGPAGFVQVLDLHRLTVKADPTPIVGPELGLLVIDLKTRGRLRFNGTLQRRSKGFDLAITQAYGNCRKYIQRREERPDGPTLSTPTPTHTSNALTKAQQERLSHADTLFLASLHPTGGADASHRGGFPGFVRVLGPQRLAFDDYPGNGMFNTLGNLLENPRAGLLHVDFTTGDVLQLYGNARVHADFSVTMEVVSVRDTPGAIPLRFQLIEYSPVNPPVTEAKGGTK